MNARDKRLQRHGIFLADTMIGFAIITVLGLVLIGGITGARRAQERLDDGATAVHIAERVLAIVQEGQKPPTTMDDATVQVAPAGGGNANGWIEVRVTYRNRTASLVGLSAKGGAQ